ncbi:auxin efflux carrier, partial [Dimargaris cristalligena]
LQVFAISLCGFVFTKKGYISKTVQKGLSVLNMNYFTPCLLFSSMVETVTPEVIVELWPMVVFYFVFSALAILICILGCRVFRISPYMHRFAIIALLFSNTNSLPISLLKGIMQSHGASILFQGPDDTPLKASGRAVSYAVIFVVFNNIFRWTVGVRLLAPYAEQKEHLTAHSHKLAAHNRLIQCPSNASLPLDSDTSTATSPRRHSLVRGLKSVGRTCAGCLNAPVYAIIAAIIVQFIPWVNDLVMEPSSVFMPIVKAIDISGDASIPVMLLSLGAQLACPSSNSPGLLSDGSKITMLVMLGRFLLIPLIVVPLLLFLRPYIPVANDDPVFMITLFVLCCMPPAVNLITVAQAMGVFEDESAKLLFYVYVSAIPILVVLVTIFLTVLSVT